MDRTWATIGGLVTWLDTEAAATGDTARLLRILKMYEETGEVCGALEDVTAPAHGPGRHTWEDAQNRLGDTIFRAMIVLTLLTPDAEKLFTSRLARIAERSGIPA
ncbi:hypothetical protein [Actinomadura formosensis]|uniref:hypothetical protein n=1 Tax=Actinomadura formosensis TaxID=60706 RepID=UPI003D907B73